MSCVTTKELAEDYKDAIDWERYARIAVAVGTQCNGRKDRFDKSDILEKSIQACSNERLLHIDDVGRDHCDTLRQLDIEMKTEQNCLFTPTGNPKKTVELKIKNSLRTTETTDIQDPADFYLIVQPNAAGLISFSEMRPYLHVAPGKDGIVSKIPFEKITEIVYRAPFHNTASNADYIGAKHKMQWDFINAIR